MFACTTCVRAKALRARSGYRLHDFIGSSHLTNAAAAVLILWEDKAKSAQRSNGEAIGDDRPDLSYLRKAGFKPEGAIGLYKHEKARLLCNSRARQYKPIHIPKEDECGPKDTSLAGSVRKHPVVFEEPDAREYAKQRYDFDIDGVPFVSQLTDRAIARVNELEAMEQ